MNLFDKLYVTIDWSSIGQYQSISTNLFPPISNYLLISNDGLSSILERQGQVLKLVLKILDDNSH